MSSEQAVMCINAAQCAGPHKYADAYPLQTAAAATSDTQLYFCFCFCFLELLTTINIRTI